MTMTPAPRKYFLRAFYYDTGGFSLIEIIVATAVSSIILLMIFSAHKSIMSAIYELTGVADYYENVNLAIHRIDRDLSCAFFSRYNEKVAFIGQNEEGSVANGRLNFVTMDHRDYVMLGNTRKEYPVSDIKRVGYYLSPDKDISGLFYLMRNEERHYDENSEAAGEESILLENVQDIRFEYKLRNEWTGKWDSKEFRKYPRAVKTTIRVKNYGGKTEEFIFISYINMSK